MYDMYRKEDDRCKPNLSFLEKYIINSQPKNRKQYLYNGETKRHNITLYIIYSKYYLKNDPSQTAYLRG